MIRSEYLANVAMQSQGWKVGATFLRPGKSYALRPSFFTRLTSMFRNF